jgi:hypothetical protein
MELNMWSKRVELMDIMRKRNGWNGYCQKITVISANLNFAIVSNITDDQESIFWANCFQWDSRHESNIRFPNDGTGCPVRPMHYTEKFG